MDWFGLIESKIDQNLKIQWSTENMKKKNGKK